MLAYQQRVVDEKRELDEKADRLSAYLASTPAVDAAELGRLRVQYAVMDAYAQVLAERIANF